VTLNYAQLFISVKDYFYKKKMTSTKTEMNSVATEMISHQLVHEIGPKDISLTALYGVALAYNCK